MAKKGEPTEKQMLFCEEFLKDLNATRAYKEIYKVSQKTAEASWPRLLGNVRVWGYIQKKIKERFEKADIDWQWVIDRLIELVDRCMQKKPVMIKRWKEYVQKKEYREDPITGKEYEVWVWSFDSAGANSALDKLGKYFKLFTEKLEISGKLETVVKKIWSKKEEWKKS